MIGLGILPSRLFIGIINDESGDIEAWTTDEEGIKVSRQFVLNIHKNGFIRKMYDGWKAQNKSTIIDMQGKELEDYFHYLNEEVHVPFSLGLAQKRRIQYVAYFSKGFIGMAAPDEQPASTMFLLERFAGVFNLTYTRFNDLQQAEAQAREAQIEASLERVRSKAMQMVNSANLSETVSVLFYELKKLHINTIRCGVGIIDETSKTIELSTTSISGGNEALEIIGNVKLEGHPVLIGTFENWKLQKEFHAVLQGEDLVTYYRIVQPQLPVPDFYPDAVEHAYFFFFSKATYTHGAITLFTENEFHIFRRFLSVLSLTYRRYIDCKDQKPMQGRP